MKLLLLFLPIVRGPDDASQFMTGTLRVLNQKERIDDCFQLDSLKGYKDNLIQMSSENFKNLNRELSTWVNKLSRGEAQKLDCASVGEKFAKTICESSESLLKIKTDIIKTLSEKILSVGVVGLAQNDLSSQLDFSLMLTTESNTARNSDCEATMKNLLDGYTQFKQQGQLFSAEIDKAVNEIVLKSGVKGSNSPFKLVKTDLSTFQESLKTQNQQAPNAEEDSDDEDDEDEITLEMISAYSEKLLTLYTSVAENLQKTRTPLEIIRRLKILQKEMSENNNLAGSKPEQQSPILNFWISNKSDINQKLQDCKTLENTITEFGIGKELRRLAQEVSAGLNLESYQETLNKISQQDHAESAELFSKVFLTGIGSFQLRDILNELIDLPAARDVVTGLELD